MFFRIDSSLPQLSGKSVQRSNQGVDGFEVVLDKATDVIWWQRFSSPGLAAVNNFEGVDQLVRGELGRSLIEPRGFRIVQVISGEVFGNTVDGANCGSGARSLEDKLWIPASSRRDAVDFVRYSRLPQWQAVMYERANVYPRCVVGLTGLVTNSSSGVVTSDTGEDKANTALDVPGAIKAFHGTYGRHTEILDNRFRFGP